MAKLYFKYGAMGSSKSAQALITQFNYEELGMTVWLIKPSVDDRDGANIIRSRIGLQREAQVIHPNEDIIATFARAGHADVIIADEAQFFSPEQIDQLRRIVDEQNIPVLCFGLRTDFLTHFFPGARRLLAPAGDRPAVVPLGRRRAGGLLPDDALHTRGASARDGIPLRGLLGLSGDRVLRPHQPLWYAAGLHVLCRYAPPRRHRRAHGLGPGALSEGRARARAL